MITANRALLAVVAYCAAMGAVIYKRQHPAPRSAPASDLPIEPVADISDTSGIQGGRYLTPRGRAYALTVFTDYQCPACRAFEHVLASLGPGLGESLTVAVRHLPLERIHPAAMNAAVAADCAARQGRFASMHSALFENQDAIGNASFRIYAERAQVAELAAFDDCVESQATLDAIRIDLALARRLKFSTTPVLVIGKVRVNGTPSAKLLDSLLRANGRN